MASRDIHRYSPLGPREPYCSLAGIYDRVMAHVDYDSWLLFIEDIIERHSRLSHPSIIEVGGGTGILGNKFIKQGSRYFGSDLSFSMCKEARQKKLPFVCADAKSLPFKTSFDLMLFLYDGINYLLKITDYTEFFKEASHCLKQNGLLLFDITTKTNSMKYFQNFLDFDDFGDCTYVRHSYYEPSSSYQLNDFTVFCRSKTHGSEDFFHKFVEHHVQKVFSAQEILDVIPRNIFEITGVWDGFSFKKFSPRSERIHFLLRKL